MQFNEFYYNDSQEFITEVHQLLEDAFDSDELDPAFVAKLVNYLETGFPTYADLNSRVAAELRKVVRGDNKQVLKIRKKVLDIINKAKARFLDGVDRRCGNIKVQSKDKLEPQQNSQET